MSYSRSYHETVSQTVSKTVSVSYPASQSGGSTSVTVSMVASIPVDVNILVDTYPFDSSVQTCSNNVNVLTAAVVASQSAMIVAKEKNSKKVADTIIGGFFSYVKSEISQQISELSQNVDALLMHIRELSKSCLAMKTQMEGDYNRITSRYSRTFEELNRELSNRIYELDRPVFGFKRETDFQRKRSLDNGLVNTASVFGAESCNLQAKVGISITKKRAFDTLSKARQFLWQQKKLNNTIQHSMLNENVSSQVYAPVCFVELIKGKNQTDKNIYTPDYLTGLKDDAKSSSLMDSFSSGAVSWVKITPEDEKNLKFYFNKELNATLIQNDAHTTRVREMIRSITDISSIKTINP
jgi:hypothetical protein